MILKIKHFSELTINELYDLLKLRSEIFIFEQNCAYNDVDGKDTDAIHLMMNDDNGQLIAYIRLLKPGVSYKDSASIGRVICKKEARGKGYGKQIMLKGIDYIINIWGYKKITISAQEYLKNFYAHLGFKIVSGVYLEDDMPHIKMIYISE